MKINVQGGKDALRHLLLRRREAARKAGGGTDPNTQAVTYYLADKNLALSQILEERDGAGDSQGGVPVRGDEANQAGAGATSSYYLGDHLSTRILTDSTGTAQNVYTYRPYGEIERQTGAGAGNTLAVGNSVLSPGSGSIRI